MKVGIVSDFYYPWIAGPSIAVRNIGHGLLARGHSVSLLAPSPVGPRYWEMEGGLDIFRASTLPLPFGYRVRVASRSRRDATSWLDRVKPDVVHVHHPFPLSASAAEAARKRGIPVAATNHTIPACSLWGIRNTGVLYSSTERVFGQWILHVLNKADRVATPTETAADLLRALGFERDIEILSNGVDATRFAPGESDGGLQERLGLDERPVVLYTGRLDAEKQMDVWLRAAAMVTAKADAQFVVGGRGTEEGRLRELASELGLEHRVRFSQYLSDDEYPSLYRLADVFFITAPVELQSITTLEAIASGLPVVGVHAGALPELIRDGRNGFLVPPADPRAAADALVRLLQNEDERRALGSHSRALALDHDLLRSMSAYEEWLTSARQRGQGDPTFERIAAARR